MSLKLNVAANYASQLYATLIGIALIPLYLKFMGAEAYGLVGFFAMLQAWFNVLDLGLTPTIARQSARFFGGALSATDYRRLFRSLSTIFAVVAIVGGGALFTLAPAIADKWLHPHALSSTVVVTAVRIMAASVAMRWMGGLYRGVVTGAERLVLLAGLNALIATLRFAGVFASMAVWGYTPTVFFCHQAIVATLELLALLHMSTRLMPRRNELEPPVGWSFTAVRPLLRFSLTIAFTSSVWVFVTQTDKLILSGILPLSDYGYFTLAVLVAGGITIVTGPIQTALLPRLARLHAEKNDVESLRLYSQFAQLTSVIAFSLMATLALGAETMLFAWTGKRDIAQAAAPILRLYALGNGLLALGAFPFYLQYARGTLRYHLIGNIGMVILLVPAIVLAAIHAGGVGAGWVWLGMNVLYLFGWVAYVHHKLEPGLHVRWMKNSVVAVGVPTAVTTGFLAILQPWMNDLSRMGSLTWIILMGSLIFTTASMSAKSVRVRILHRFRNAGKRVPTEQRGNA